MDYSLGIFIADTSSLKNRAFMFAFVNSPYIATTWIGGPLATAFLDGPGFRWGYGVFVGTDGKAHVGIERSPLLMLVGKHGVGRTFDDSSTSSASFT